MLSLKDLHGQEFSTQALETVFYRETQNTESFRKIWTEIKCISEATVTKNLRNSAVLCTFEELNKEHGFV
jgi:hypothetical protein